MRRCSRFFDRLEMTRFVRVQFECRPIKMSSKMRCVLEFNGMQIERVKFRAVEVHFVRVECGTAVNLCN